MYNKTQPKSPNRIRRLIIFIFFIAILMLGLYSEPEITELTFTSDSLPKSFNGFKIVVLSDLHNEVFGTSQDKLIKIIDSCSPDIIVLTGDIIDRDTSDFSPVTDLLDGICSKYPVYAVTGNHEYDNSDYLNTLYSYYEQYNVALLENDFAEIKRDGEVIYIYGIPYMSKAEVLQNPQAFDIRNNTKNSYILNNDIFSILLYHDPEIFDIISKADYDIIFSGHVHGGVIRLPFIGGMLSPNVEFFPKYDSGIYTKNNTALVVSRGLGQTIIPRFNNRPEIVCITLFSGK